MNNHYEQDMRNRAANAAYEAEAARLTLAQEQLQRFRETPAPEPEERLTLRDRFALEAPLPDPGWMAIRAREGGFSDRFEMEAAWRYEWAGRMIAAREKKDEA